MFTLINDLPIIRKHYGTLSEEAKPQFIIILFFIIPIVVSFTLIVTNRLLTYESVGALLTAFAVFTGLLLNVIFILFDVVDKSNGKKTNQHDMKMLLRNLYANSMYALLISTANLTLLIIIIIVGDAPEIKIRSIELVTISSGIVYFGITHFLMNLLMIFRRLYILLYHSNL